MSISRNPAVFSSHWLNVRIGIWCFSRVPGLVRLRPFSLSFFFSPARRRSMVAGLMRDSYFLTTVTARRCLIVSSLTAPPLQLLRLPKRTESANQFG